MSNQSHGERLREMASKMAGVSEGFDTVLNEDGISETRVMKGDRDSLDSGLEYALMAVGARMARGDIIDKDEISELIQKARELKIDSPQDYVEDAIALYRSQTEKNDRIIE